MAANHSRGRIWAILFTAPALLALVSQGFWQLHRLHWKNNLMHERQTALNKPSLAFPGYQTEFQNLNFRRVTIQGAFLLGQNLYIGPRSLSGRAGFHVLTPFRLKDHRVILINRGFVPGAGAKALPWQDTLSGKPVRIVGILRHPAAPSTMTPKNQPVKGIWHWYDMPVLARALKLRLLPVVLDLHSPQPSGDLPVPGQTRVKLVNNHLQYAVTWFAFAAVLVVIFVLFLRRNQNDQPGPDATL